MANNKTGFNYYNTDTDRYQDIRIKRLKKTFGCSGIAVYDYILCEIYRVKGCFIEWDESTAFDVAEYYSLKESLVNEIVSYCCSVGLFSKELLASGNVLTSQSIQRRYVEMAKRAKRNDLKIPEEINIIREECEIIPEESPIIPSRARVESKVEKSRVEESKEDRDNKLSLSVACATDKERDRFFEIFFFRNFVNPAAEVERFVSNYEASGWVRSNGQLAKNREALAKAWAEEPKNREAKRRFTDEFLFKWEILYGQTKKEGKLNAGVLLRGICGAHFEDEGNTLRLAVTQELTRMLSGNWDVYFVRFFDKYYPGKQIKWWMVK